LWYPVWNLSTDAAAAPTSILAGITGRAITGSAATDTVLFSDNLTVIDIDASESASSVVQTLPTPAMLENTNFGYSLTNHSVHTASIVPCTNGVGGCTPATYTINGAANLSVPAGNFVRIKVDPNSATNWLADVAASALTSGVTNFSGDGTLISNSSSVGAVTVTLANAGAYAFWGNNTGSTAAPGYHTIPAAAIPTAIPIGNIGSAGLSGTSPISIAATGAISCPTCAKGPGTSTATDLVSFTNTDGVTLSDSGLALGNVATAASNYVSGNLIQGAGANKTTSDSAVAVSNLVLLNASNAHTGTTNSFSGVLSDSKNGALSLASFGLTGSPVTGGTGTTTYPLAYFNAGSAPSTWSTAGTELGFNAPSGFTGNLLDFHVNGGNSVAKLDYQGNITVTSCSGCGTGTGTVTVVGAGNLTSTAIMTGGGSQASQTPSATATLNSSGNMSLPGTLAVTGHVTFEGVTSTGAQGTGALVFSGSPFLTTPNIGAATGTSLNASGVLISGANGGTGGSLTLNGATSGSCAITVAATGGTPSLCGTSVTPGNLVFASSPGAGIAHFAGSTQTVTSSAIVDADVSFTTPAIAGATATTQSAGNNTTKVATTAYVNTVYNLIQTSGSPYSMAGLTGFYWNNSGAAYTFQLDAPVAGKQYCFGNYSGETHAITVKSTTNVYIVYKGANGTVTTGTLVSVGAAGDFVCMEGVDTTHYMVTGAGYGTWTNN
jgi:hypothetical protein